jgi:hypothetical protein
MDITHQGEAHHEGMYTERYRRYGTAVLGAAAAMPGWAWWGVAFVMFAGFAMWRARRRLRAGVDGSSGEAGDGWGATDQVAMGGVWLSLLLLLTAAVLDLGDIDLGRSLGGP